MVGVAALIVGLVANYVRFIEKMELFVAKEEAIAQTAQMKSILDQLDSEIFIAFKLPDSKFISKYFNKKINLLFQNDQTGMSDSNEDHQQFFDSQVFARVKD